jgi:type II secretory pathway component GspD/PulD (secretin)
MRATTFLCGLLIVAGCDSGNGTGGLAACVELEGGQLAGGSGTPQVLIEARIVATDRDFLEDAGIVFPLGAPVQTDNGGALGGLSRQGRNVVADSDTAGGPADVPYLVTNGFDGILSVVNPNFASPFAGLDVKVFPGLPFPGQCVKCQDAAVTPIQNFAGGSDEGVLSPIDPGLLGTILHGILDSLDLDSILSAIDADARNDIIAAPEIRTYGDQRVIVGIQDVVPQVSQLAPEFRGAVQSVVQNPFAVFTGFALDVTVTVEGDAVRLVVRPGTQMASAQRSVPAMVGATPVDVEIPFLRPSTNYVSILVPDGQTLVLGGIHLQGQPEATKGLPLLADLPLVGALFNHQVTEPERQNLLIFITPRIINAD